MDWTRVYHAESMRDPEEHRSDACPVTDTNKVFVQKGNILSDEMQTADRRVQRTRYALRDALIALLAERGWDDINIQDLCERANVGRSTFYMHFQNKEQLLVSGFDDLRAWLCSDAAAVKKGDSDSLPFVRGLIDHVYEQRTLFRAIVGRRSGHVVQKRFREMVGLLVEKDISLRVAGGWQRDAGVNFIAGALVELLAWWVDAGKGRTADDIERLFDQLSLPVIRQLAN